MQDGMARSHVAVENPFPRSTYLANLQLVQQDIRRRSLSAVAIFDPEHIFWLTGFRSIGYFTFQCLIVPADGAPTMVSRRVNRDIALGNENIQHFVGIEDTDDAVGVLAGVIAKLCPTGRLGLETESWYLTVAAWKQLQRLGAVAVDDWPAHVIESARKIKSAAQLDFMKQAADAAVAGLDAAVKLIAPGRSENDLAAAMLHGATKAGSEYTRVPLVVTGKATGVCFTTWQRRRIEPGDVVFLEAAANINRYHAMIARNCVAGRATGEQKRWAAVVIEGLNRAIDAIRPGVTSGAVDAACRGVFERAGVAQYFNNRTAYAIGIGFPPNWAEGRFLSLRRGDPTVLEPGMTFHLVPALFMPEFGFCFSESVAVTDTGVRVLTEYPRELIEVEA